jgi:hypothetical protein
MPGYMRLLAACVAMTGCAQVSDIPLQPDGLTPIVGASRGFRHYLPRPYLLVMELPPPASSGGSPGSGNIVDVPPPPGFQQPPGAAPAAGGTGTGSKPPASTDTQAGSSQTPPTDTGFLASTATYVAKLIYLQDYSRPMAVTLDPGLFGLASVSLSLQDGWMLTNVSANADNTKFADVVTAAIQAISSTGGAPKAASTATKAAGPPGAGPSGTPPISNVLKPGLYAFDFTVGASRVSGLCAIAYFDSSGSHLTKPGDVGACGPDQSRQVVGQAPGAPPVVR